MLDNITSSFFNCGRWVSAIKNAKNGYARIKNLAKYLIINIWRAAGRRSVALKINSYGSIFSLKFAKKEEFKTFYKTMLEKGIYLAPSEFEANFISFAHTKKDIDRTIKAAIAAFGRIKR